MSLEALFLSLTLAFFVGAVISGIFADPFLAGLCLLMSFASHGLWNHLSPEDGGIIVSESMTREERLSLLTKSSVSEIQQAEERLREKGLIYPAPVKD